MTKYGIVSSLHVRTVLLLDVAPRFYANLCLKECGCCSLDAGVAICIHSALGCAAHL